MGHGYKPILETRGYKMDVVQLAEYGLHGLLIVCVLYLARKAERHEKMLIKCLQGEKLTDADLTSLIP